VITEDVGRNLAARVAVDARVIDEELARDVLRQPPSDLRRDALRF
jgi:hypothetical protein